ncbi:hypothetical protein Tco_0384978 [Tanacetum coccineum]
MLSWSFFASSLPYQQATFCYEYCFLRIKHPPLLIPLNFVLLLSSSFSLPFYVWIFFPSFLLLLSFVPFHSRVESYRDLESLGEDASKQGRINAIDADEDITLVNDQDDADMFDVNTLTGDAVLAEPEVVVKDVNLTVGEVTLAQALAALKSVKPKVKANVVEEPSVPVSAASTKVSAATTIKTATILTPRKGIVITELEEPVKSMKKKYLVRLDEEIASKLQAKFDEEERLKREKDEANVALTEEWDDIQAKVDANYQLAQRMQAEEQEQFTNEQKATLFKELLEQRRKHFEAKRAEEKRNKPPTQAKQRKIMCTYLKNMEGKKPKDLKNKSFDSIQKMFDKTFKRVNTFVEFRTDLVEETVEVDNDQEAAKIKELIEIVPDKEELAIDAIPLAVKPPIIVDRKIHKGRKKTYYQIIKADGSSKIYLVFSHMLKRFDREDLETLWKLVKAKHRSTRPEEGYERVLWVDLTIMFKPHVEDTIYMLVEKKYHLTLATITDMLNKKLQCDHFSEMAYQFLKLLTKQLKNQLSGKIVGIKRLLDDLRVTAAQVCVTAAKLNYYCSKIKTAERVSTVRERIKTKERIKIV